jgi:hypothetical protein
MLTAPHVLEDSLLRSDALRSPPTVSTLALLHIIRQQQAVIEVQQLELDQLKQDVRTLKHQSPDTEEALSEPTPRAVALPLLRPPIPKHPYPPTRSQQDGALDSRRRDVLLQEDAHAEIFKSINEINSTLKSIISDQPMLSAQSGSKLGAIESETSTRKPSKGGTVETGNLRYTLVAHKGITNPLSTVSSRASFDSTTRRTNAESVAPHRKCSLRKADVFSWTTVTTSYRVRT